MSLARKCDRCGDYYTPESRIMKEAGGRVNAIRLMDIRYTEGMIDQQRKMYDLCPRCLYELERWLHEREDQDGREL